MRALGRLRERRDLWVLGALLAAGIGLRAWLTAAWRPAMLGYSDTGGYLEVAAGDSLFANPDQPAGYPLFLRGVHLLGARIELVALAQHALGVASALLLWAAVRRLGAPGWAALLAAAVPLLFGTGIFAEHAVITESLFAFLQAAAVYAWARTASGGGLAWAAVVGLAIAAAATVRVVGLVFVPLLVLAVSPAPVERRRLRLAHVAVAGVSAGLVLGGYLVAHDQATGHLGFTRAGAWNLYGRTAVFADCREFTPPQGTEALCQTVSTDQRPGPNNYVHEWADSPALQAFGWPNVAEQEDNDRVSAFARAAIRGTPRTYAGVVLEDLSRYWDSNRAVRPGVGLGSEGLVRDYLLAETARALQPYWDNGSGYSVGATEALAGYERATRIQGPVLLVLVLLALPGPLLARGRARMVATVPALLGLGGLVVPVAAYMYDARFALPAYGVLAAASSLGVAAAVQRFRLIRETHHGRSAADARPAVMTSGRR